MKKEKRAPLAAKTTGYGKNPAFFWKAAGFWRQNQPTGPQLFRRQIRTSRCLKENLTSSPKPKFLSQEGMLTSPTWWWGLSPQTTDRAPRCRANGFSPPASGCWVRGAGEGWGWGSGGEASDFFFHSPFIPLPSSWNVLRAEGWSSKCSLPPLPEEATLLCGDRGAWSEGMHWGPLARKSSWDIHPCPRGWFGTFMGGVRDTERFKGLWCVWPERTGKKNKKTKQKTKKNKKKNQIKEVIPPSRPGMQQSSPKKKKRSTRSSNAWCVAAAARWWLWVPAAAWTLPGAPGFASQAATGTGAPARGRAHASYGGSLRERRRVDCEKKNERRFLCSNSKPGHGTALGARLRALGKPGARAAVSRAGKAPLPSQAWWEFSSNYTWGHETHPAKTKIIRTRIFLGKARKSPGWERPRTDPGEAALSLPLG